MWSYYGAKTNIVKHYPKPVHSKIIEPFAGTARYALRFFDREVLLVDKYEVIVRIWQWLQKCSPGDILGLPQFKMGENINSATYSCDEERFLVGFLVGFGFESPRKIATPRLRNRPNASLFTMKSIASQLWKIRHWEIRLGSYEDIPNEKATWFIDPPYQFGGHCYKHSNKKIDFNHLGKWSRDREGQIIVCENTKATWMPFKPLCRQNVLSGENQEAIYSNQNLSYPKKQLTLI